MLTSRSSRAYSQAKLVGFFVLLYLKQGLMTLGACLVTLALTLE
jgi:hypothetical protein